MDDVERFEFSFASSYRFLARAFGVTPSTALMLAFPLVKPPASVVVSTNVSPNNNKPRTQHSRSGNDINLKVLARLVLLQPSFQLASVIVVSFLLCSLGCS